MDCVNVSSSNSHEYPFRLRLELGIEDVNDNAPHFDGLDLRGEIVFEMRENEPNGTFRYCHLGANMLYSFS